jgi:hypothetical protein
VAGTRKESNRTQAVQGTRAVAVPAEQQQQIKLIKMIDSINAPSN